MNEIFAPGIDAYIDGLLPARNEILAEMEDLAEKSGFPIIGPQVGRFLYQIVRLKKPKKIFEMGSGFGYSACWFCLGSPDVQVICTETSEQNIGRGKEWMKSGGFADRVEFHLGKAQEVLEEIGGRYDIILVDVDKHEYPAAFPQALKHLNKDGLLITDNVLWHARITDASATDRDTEGVRQYNRLIFNTPGVYSTIVPIRDGVALTLKL